MSELIARCYIALRRVLRRVLQRQGLLGPTALNRLAGIDESLRRMGVLRGAPKDLFEYDGCRFSFGPDSRGIAEAIFTNGEYEGPTVRELNHQLRPGSIFIDAGANIGFFSILASRRVGERGSVYAFEPTATTRAYLVRNTTANGATNVVVEPLAIGARRHRAHFRITEESEANHILDGKPVATSDVTVDVVSIDAYCAERGVERLDLVKLDIEGQELPALEGMRDISRQSPSMAVIFELNAEAIHRNGKTIDEFFVTLADLGFRRFRVLLDEPVEFGLEDSKDFLYDITRRYNANILASK